MTFEQTRAILKILKTNYPQSFKNWTKEQSIDFLNLWAEAFKDEPAQIVVAAVKAIIYSDTREFAPNIGQVKNKIFELTNDSTMSEHEAWGLVFNALSNSGYHAKEEFEKLPPVIQRIVGGPSQLKEWCMMDTQTLNSVVSSNFMRSYRSRAKYEQEYQALPNEIKTMLSFKQEPETKAIESIKDINIADNEEELLNEK